MSKISAILVIFAGILGGSGVSLAAAAAHVSDSTALRAAAEISMVHAAAILALAALSHQSKAPLVWNLAGIAMALGAVLFTGTVALGALADFRPLPALAPIGGSLTILSWLGVVVAGVREFLTPRS